VRRLIRAGLMTPAGLAKIQTRMDEPFVIPADILRTLKKDATTWKNFQAFPEYYRRIRIGWIEATRQQGRWDVFERRLSYFLKMTAQNTRFGMVK
jgi:Bacteriocin-protection, YdeI or OmpD-Associated